MKWKGFVTVTSITPHMTVTFWSNKDTKSDANIDIFWQAKKEGIRSFKVSKILPYTDPASAVGSMMKEYFL